MKNTSNASPLPPDVLEAIADLDEKHHDQLVRMLRGMFVRKPRAPRPARRIVTAPSGSNFTDGGVFGLGERPPRPSPGSVFGAVASKFAPKGDKAA